MSKYEKLFQRFLSKPTDFTWNELEALLNGVGYFLMPGGKTGGSRVRFVHANCAPIILHKPHPRPILRRYQIQDIINLLKEEGIL